MSDNKMSDNKSWNDLTSSLKELNVSRRSYYGRPSFYSRNRPPPGKWWWKSPTGFYIAAGGIIICDVQKSKKGIWVLVEKSRRGSGHEYTDIGGKYDWNDGDIYATIAREFREELYNTDEIPYTTIKELCLNREKEETLFVMRKGKYMCLIVERDLLPSLNLDAKLVEDARVKILDENPFCRDEMYRTMSLRFLSFDAIADYKIFLSYRLISILKDSSLRDKIPRISSLES